VVQVTIEAGDFAFVQKLVMDRAAIVLNESKEYLVESRLTALARKKKLDSLGALLAEAKNGKQNGLLDEIIDAMTTNETSFLRDVHPFEMMRKIVLPDLIRKRQVEKKLHIWCGASSSGQEPYTIAMMLREHFWETLRDWSVVFIASDLSTEMLDRSRAGSYSQLEVNRGLPAPLLVKYFDKDGSNWQVRDEIREMVDFRQINLVKDWPTMPPLDLVLMRNVLIYFDVPTKKKVLARVRERMRPDGYLFLGGAETTLNLDDAFERVQGDKAGCYRLKEE
jgi:chemotaxis protein methyltransferase CheR